MNDEKLTKRMYEKERGGGGEGEGGKGQPGMRRAGGWSGKIYE